MNTFIMTQTEYLKTGGPERERERERQRETETETDRKTDRER